MWELRDFWLHFWCPNLDRKGFWTSLKLNYAPFSGNPFIFSNFFQCRWGDFGSWSSWSVFNNSREVFTFAGFGALVRFPPPNLSPTFVAKRQGFSWRWLCKGGGRSTFISLTFCKRMVFTPTFPCYETDLTLTVITFRVSSFWGRGGQSWIIQERGELVPLTIWILWILMIW